MHYNPSVTILHTTGSKRKQGGENGWGRKGKEHGWKESGDING